MIIVFSTVKAYKSITAYLFDLRASRVDHPNNLVAFPLSFPANHEQVLIHLAVKEYDLLLFCLDVFTWLL